MSGHIGRAVAQKFLDQFPPVDESVALHAPKSSNIKACYTGNMNIVQKFPDIDPRSWIPSEIGTISNHQTDLPRIAKNARAVSAIEAKLSQIPTLHDLRHGNASDLKFLSDKSVHLVVTSPPYWTLKRYNNSHDQLGHVEDYEEFIEKLNEVWRECFRVLVPGGRLICVVGDVCLSRRKNGGEHTVVPLHATIQENCRKIGFSNLAPIDVAPKFYPAASGVGRLLMPCWAVMAA